MRSRPKYIFLTAIRFQALIGVKKGDLNNGCNSARREIVVLGTTTVSDSAVTSGSLGVPGPVDAREVSISGMVEAAISCTVIHSGLNSTDVGRI